MISPFAAPFPGLVCVPGFGQVGAVVFVADPETACQALTLVAFLYADAEVKRGRERAA